MAAYRQVYDSRHLQADCKNRDRLRNPTLNNRVWAAFTFLPPIYHPHRVAEPRWSQDIRHRWSELVWLSRIFGIYFASPVAESR